MALDRVLRSAFPGQVKIFNTSRATSGLAAGQSIDAGILKAVANSGVMIWLASPTSIVKSFWMAWELGIASAKSVPLIPARCLGVRPDQLPLLQGGRFSPDLGERGDLLDTLESVKGILGLTDDKISETIDSLESPRNPFWGQQAKDVIALRAIGSRLLIENRTGEVLKVTGLSIASGDPMYPDLSTLAEWASNELLGPYVKRTLHLNSDMVLMRSVSLRFEWNTENGARFHSMVPVRA